MQTKFTSEYIEYLGHKFKEGKLTSAEQDDFESWYLTQTQAELDLSKSGDIESADELSVRLYTKIANRLAFKSAQQVRKFSIKRWRRIVVAASLLFTVCSIGLFIYLNQQPEKNSIVANNDVAPGKTGGTLTLADGSKIFLKAVDTGKIAVQSGIEIRKHSNGDIVYLSSGNNADELRYNTLTTSRAEQIRVHLPDGSIVLLNAASSLRFPVSFTNNKERIVELTGEGYFEIKKNRSLSFKVMTHLQEIEVLGTHFNINAYKDEPAVTTTLLEGKIKLLTKNDMVTLNPGDQAVLIDNTVQMRKVDTEEAVAWKNNEFFFRDDDFRTNMRKIARWYDLDLVYQDSAPDNFKLGGYLSRSRNLSEVLKLLERTDKVHFRLEGRKLYVSK